MLSLPLATSPLHYLYKALKFSTLLLFTTHQYTDAFSWGIIKDQKSFQNQGNHLMADCHSDRERGDFNYWFVVSVLIFLPSMEGRLSSHINSNHGGRGPETFTHNIFIISFHFWIKSGVPSLITILLKSLGAEYIFCYFHTMIPSQIGNVFSWTVVKRMCQRL